MNTLSHISAPPSILSPRVIIPFLIVTLIWSSTWIVIRSQLGVVPPSWSVVYRFAIGAVAMFAYAIVTKQPIWLSASGQRFAFVFGVAQFVWNFNFVYRAEGYITSGLVAVVFALLFVPNTIIARIFLGQTISRRFLFGSLIAVFAIILLFVNEALAHPHDHNATLLGVGLTFSGVMGASVANVMQATQRARALPMASLIGWGMVWGSLVNASYAYASAGPPVFDLRPQYIAGVVYLAVAASAVSFTLYFGVIRAIGPSKAAYSSVAIPVLAMLISTVFEGYHWSPLGIAGGILGLIGLLIALGARKSQPN